MTKKAGPDIKKIEKIETTLKKHFQGLWIRELSRKTGIDKSTTSRYINNYMKNKIEIENIGNLIKIVRLK